MERTRRKEFFIRDWRLDESERRQHPANKPQVKPVDAYELALRCYLANPSTLTAYALRLADIERMKLASERTAQPQNIAGRVAAYFAVRKFNGESE